MNKNNEMRIKIREAGKKAIVKALCSAGEGDWKISITGVKTMRNEEKSLC